MDTIDLGRAFKAPFTDKDWVTKTLLGFVWVLLVVTIPAVYGAQIEYIRRVSRGDETLPGWEDFGDKWVQGVLVFIASIIYFLPVLVLMFLFLVPVAVSVAVEGEPGALASVTAIGGACLVILIATVYGIAASILFYAAQVHFAMSGSFGAFFEFGRIMDKVRSGGYFTAWLYSLVIAVGLSFAASIAASATGGLLAVVSPAVTYITMMMVGHVLGQWAARAYGITTPAWTAETSTPAGPGGGYPPPPPPSPGDDDRTVG